MVKTRKSMDNQTVAENVPEPKVGEVAEETSAPAALPEDVVPKVVEEAKEVQEAPAVVEKEEQEAEAKPEDNQQAEAKPADQQEAEAESKPEVEKDSVPECDKQENAVEEEKPTEEKPTEKAEQTEDVSNLKRSADEANVDDEETLAAKKLKTVVEGSEEPAKKVSITGEE